MKILVTGGAGFIASHIVDAYIEDNHDVVVIDDLSSGKKDYLNPKARFYKADIRDKKIVGEIIAQEKPQVINHHAAQISVRKSVEDPIYDAQTNLCGLLNLLESGKNNGLKKVIFASSGGVVYGEAEVIPTPESYTPLLPLSPYGVAKLASEYYLHFYQKTYGISYVALRYSNVYGPRQNPHGEAGVVAIFSKKLIQNQIPVINGDGLQTRDYVYVADVARANQAALSYKDSGLFNIGTGKETDVVTLFQNISRIMKSSIQAAHGEVKKGEQKRSCLNINLAKDTLQWVPQTDLNTGLAQTVEFFKKNE
jgi:UDP-glucose 4-epimerase